MNSNKKTAILAACAMALTCIGAQASLVTGTIWENFPTLVGNENGSIANANTLLGLNPGGNVTFVAPSNPLAFNSNGTSDYTIGSFLGTGGATSIVYKGSAASTDTMNDTLFYFTGLVTVTNGQQFQAGHDDGLELIIDGIDVINVPGVTAYALTTTTYTGPTGTFPFQLAYAEVEGAPGVLTVALPLQSQNTPDGGQTAILLGIGLACVAGLRKVLPFVGNLMAV